MNSNKTSLKSQLIRLGLVVPLALVSVGAAADEAATAAVYAAPSETKVDATEYGKEKDQETDFSSDPFLAQEGVTSETSFDGLAAQALLAELNKTGNKPLNAYFAAGYAAGRDLINFNPAGVSDGALSVQVGLGSSGQIFEAKPAVAAVEAVAAVPAVPASEAGVTPVVVAKPAVPAVAAVEAAAAQLADLTVSTKKVVLGTGVASSLNGSDELILGGFAGYGVIGFASQLHAEKGTTEADKKNYKASVAAKSSGFGGGVFATYKVDASSPFGLSASAKIRYTQLTHLLTKKEVVDSKIKKTYFGYKNGAVNADLNVGYALEVAKVAGFPIIVKANVGVVADYDKFEQEKKDDDTKGVLLLNKRLGLTLSTALLDGKLSPSVTVGLSQANPLASQGDKFATIKVPTQTGFTKTIGAGLQYAFSDTIALGAGFQKVLLPAKAKDAVAKECDLLDASDGQFGLVYRF